MSDTVECAGRLTVEIVDHLEHETDGPAVLTGLGAACVVELDRFGESIDRFVLTLRMIKRGRDAELARQSKEN